MEEECFNLKAIMYLKTVYKIQMSTCLTNYNSEKTKEVGWWMYICTNTSNYFLIFSTFSLFCKFQLSDKLQVVFLSEKKMPFVFTNALMWVTKFFEIFFLVTIQNMSAIRIKPFYFCFVLNCLQLHRIHFLWSLITSSRRWLYSHNLNYNILLFT